jgi:hypothetical protein
LQLRLGWVKSALPSPLEWADAELESEIALIGLRNWECSAAGLECLEGTEDQYL